LANKRPAFRENIHRLFDEAQAADLAPGIVSLIESRATQAQIREVPVSKILPNPAQPRLSYDEESLTELADSIREHGVLQPILVRPAGTKYELIAGERRWRASGMAGRETIPAIVVEFDEQTALEVSIIENLQREDVSPLEEATMFRRMTDTFGYSVRQLAQKVGKDKGYVENRLRLTDAPADIRELVSLRKDTISHAYELMKIGDERKRRRLAKRIVAGELSLAKLRLITTNGADEHEPEKGAAKRDAAPRRRGRTVAGQVAEAKAADDALMGARAKLSEGVDDMVDILRQPELMEQIPEVNRANFAKHLTITKLKIENAIAIIRAGAPARDEAE
jgi:ParB family chromosome partitioning protein